VYYAPPGAEKTTAASKELFIGFDTDWIGTGITWKVLTLLFREEVPIITNQESIFFGSGIKVIGIVKKRIRDRLDRKGRIKAEHKSHRKNFILEEMHDRIFMSDCLLNLQIHNVIQRMTISYALNQMPFYMAQKPKRGSPISEEQKNVHSLFGCSPRFQDWKIFIQVHTPRQYGALAGHWSTSKFYPRLQKRLEGLA
jgi:hypothetical protein